MKEATRNLLAALVVCAPLSAAAQAPFDLLQSKLAQPSLQFPEKPAEGAPSAEPDMGAYKPAGPGPFPAVVLHHNCAGIADNIGDWSNLFVKAGYVAFVLDSFTQRGVRRGQNCRRPARVNTIEAALDAARALEHLASQSYVDPDRIALIGFSWGASASLLSARSDVAAALPRERKALRYRAVAALYPHCFIPALRSPEGPISVEWLSPDIDRPLLVLMGESDEETPPKFCLPRLEALRAKGARVEWQVYPGATHFWDGRKASGHVNETFFGGRHMLRYNPEVTQASQQRVLQFFAKELSAK